MFKTMWAQLKEAWNGLAPKTKQRIKVGAVIVILIALGLTIVLNVRKMGYRELFPGMSRSEVAQVYATLQGMDVQAEINDKGQLMVPNDQYDQLLLLLAGLDYPKTTLSYDTFLNNTGFTSTEFDKKQILIFSLQDRIQQTLMMQSGVETATVTLNIPENSNYVWDQQNREVSTAGVTVTMRPGSSLSPERVSAIKNLVASSVPNMEPKSVVVVDGATGVEMSSMDDASALGSFSVQRLEFERAIEKALEDNVKRLLYPNYGAQGVTAVAKVVVDYDKMLTERKEYVPQDNGRGVVNHFDEQYTTGGYLPAQGIVGEENNTDIPQYRNDDGSEMGMTDYSRYIDYDISYILTQIEKGEPLLKKATIAVLVNDSYLDTERTRVLIDLISKGVNISPENISVSSFDLQVDRPAATQTEPEGPLSLRTILILALAGLLLLLTLIVIILSILRRRRRRREEEEDAQRRREEEQKRRELENEISQHKLRLQEEALAGSNPKENAITEEIRSFAKHNPEVTAELIRSIMKEDR